MKRLSYLLRGLKSAVCALLVLCTVSAPQALADTLDLTTIPLATATTTIVKPNLMFILDNSGSMNWDYMPDWVVDGQYCKGSNPLGTSYHCCRNASGNYITSYTQGSTCLPSTRESNLRGMPPFYATEFNRAYYDPEKTYLPPKGYDGTELKSYDATTEEVYLDGYKKQSSSTLHLLTEYPDVEWCTDTSYTDCLRNDNYLLPGTVGGKSYTTMRATTASGTKKFAQGTVETPAASASRTVGPFYYVMVPGEYCLNSKQTTCQVATSSSDTYPYAAKVRWCSDEALTDCQITQTTAYNYPRYPTIVLSGAIPAADSMGEITVTDMPRSGWSYYYGRRTGTDSTCDYTNSKAKVWNIKLGGTKMEDINFTYCNGSNDEGVRNAGLAEEIAARIVENGFTAISNGNVITVLAPSTYYNGKSLSYYIDGGVDLDITRAFAENAVATSPDVVPGAFKRIDIVSGQTYGNVVVDGQTVVDRSNRSDCSKNAEGERECTYTQELQNFANWFAWYRTRMQMMKSSVSHAFQNIDNRYRVGFFALNSQTDNYLEVDTFNAGASNQKDDWYGKLLNAYPNGGTPLRSTLAKVGRVFAGKNPLSISGGDDPVQYSCQQNFSILTTDGYWNSDSASDIKNIDGEALGNMDGDETQSPRPMYEGPDESSGSLADVAKHYYDTDLRTTGLNNCTGSLGDGTDVCENNVFTTGTDNNIQQHMTTFTLGLGIDGTVQYQKDYQAATSGDFYNIKTGSGSPSNWPEPQQERAEAIDDLWHAAVNGKGTYYSAKNALELSDGLNDALALIGMRRGAGAAAATSSLNPVAGNNFAYVASYTTLKWKGNLESRTINLETGVVSENASWCVEDVVSGTCTSPATEVVRDSGGSAIYYCSTSGATEATCLPPGEMEGGNCLMPIAKDCTGTMRSMIGTDGASDERVIKVAKETTDGTVLAGFSYDNLTTAQQAYFGSTSLSQLSQWANLTTTQKETAVGSTFVNYLRGQYGYENRDSNAEEKRLFRYREAIIGDAMESEPAYVGKPAFNYVDSGYSTFATSNESRGKTVYLGTNDGMLHAFNAADGTERWAYVPSMVLPSMWKLADFNYSTMHANYVNGSPKVGDVQDSSGNWKTILVSGLNGGGRGYFALDVTNPAAPSFLWEIGTSSDEDIGYSYGEPIITKMADGKWVVLFTSGYNNVSPGDGKGYLYVRDALTGDAIDKISTSVGTATTPSGFAKISGWSDDPLRNNTTIFVYGGDLLGNVWRFDINASGDEGDEKVIKFAELDDASGNAQPVTIAPELGLVGMKRVVFIATGKYLENADLTDVHTQSLYAIKDNESGDTVTSPRSALAPTALVASDVTAIRTATGDGANFVSGMGWYVDFPDSGERAHIDPTLDAGVLFVPTTVPSSTICAPGGYSWLNYFDYKTGLAVKDIVSQKYDGPLVGINVYYTPDGKRHVAAVTANNPTPTKPPKEIPSVSVITEFKGRRAIWREIIP